MNRCTRCILPAAVPGISFDSDGVCSDCQAYVKPTYQGKEALIKLVTEAKQSSSRYDCIVPLSGGRDSSFVLYSAVKDLGLNVLAVNYDNEFRTDAAVANMRNACSRLNVELLEVRSNENLATKMTRHKLLCSDMTRLFGVCRACTYGHRSIVYRAAVEQGAPLIIWGSSKQEATHTLLHTAKKKLRKGESKIPALFNPHYYKYESYFRRLRHEFPMPGASLASRSTRQKKATKVREISLFDFLPWDRRLIKKTITEQLGWAAPGGRTSSWHADCELTRVVNHCFIELYGCSKHCFGYSLMINDGQIDRQEALKNEEKLLAAHDDTRDLQTLLTNGIGLTEKEANILLAKKSPLHVG